MRIGLHLGLAIAWVGLAAASPDGAPSSPPERPAGRQAQAAPNSIERWNEMSPEERERELAKLPPDRARIIRQRIRYYNSLPADEKQALSKRYEVFSQLPAEKQEIVRQRLRDYHQLPAERRERVTNWVRRFRSMTEAQRRATLNSEEFRSRFSPTEQDIIRDISTMLEPSKP
jgi:hypothetical protein